jgi:catechol 2,3-dioxygenase-like lactoylglutathione lyase family enzyme
MNLNQVTLPATNVEQSAAFYRRLGFTQIVSALPRYARFECQDGATFSLHAFDTVIPSQTVVYFECDDLDATYQRLRGLGIEFNQAPKDQIWLWREAYCRTLTATSFVFITRAVRAAFRPGACPTTRRGCKDQRHAFEALGPALR